MKIKELPESIGNLRVDGYLNLSHNCIHDLPVCITTMRILGGVNLSCNGILHLPTGFGSIKVGCWCGEKVCPLGSLQLSYNNLEELPQGMDQIRVRRDLFLDHNFLFLIMTTIRSETSSQERRLAPR